MNNYDIIGFVAAFLTTFSFLPQAIKVIKTKETEGISLIMYIVFILGVIMWTIYGFIIENLPMMFANIVTLVFAGIILWYKLQSIKK